MHVLFVHRSFPARFGHLAQRLVDRHGCRVTFVSARGGGSRGGIRRLAYEPVGGDPESTQPLARPFAVQAAHAQGVLRALRVASAADASMVPDVVVGQGGVGATTLLPELWPDVPIVNLFETFHSGRPPGGASGVPLAARLRARLSDAAVLLDLETAAVGYCPTEYQRGLFPVHHRDALAVVPDGVDTQAWQPVPVEDRRVGDAELGPDDQLVTYLARPGEPAAGRELVSRVAAELVEGSPRVHVLLVAPGDHPGDRHPRVHVQAALRPAQLRAVLSMSDLHLHVSTGTVPWSLLDAMACGVPLLSTDSPAVREVVTDGVDGALVAPSPEAVVARASELLQEGTDARQAMGAGARRTVLERYSMEAVMPRMIDVLAQALGTDHSAFDPRRDQPTTDGAGSS